MREVVEILENQLVFASWNVRGCELGELRSDKDA